MRIGNGRGSRALKTVLLSVRPEFAEAILTGEKRYEFRKRPFPVDVFEVFIYATSPSKRILGRFTVAHVAVTTPAGAWLNFGREGAIDKKRFLSYYATRDVAICIRVGRVDRASHGVDLRRVLPSFHAPQSFRYVDARSRQRILRSFRNPTRAVGHTRHRNRGRRRRPGTPKARML